MATRAEIATVYAGAVVQGIVLVTFPAVSSIFTSPEHFHLSNTQYGGMFVPQAITAIAASLLGAGLTRLVGGKRVLLLGLMADLLSMALLFASQYTATPVAFGVLLAATGCLGVGFGFTVPALNTFTAAFFPAKVDQAILTLNALLGLGTALAPIFASIFVGLHLWWGLPLLMGCLALGLIFFAWTLPLLDPPTKTDSATPSHVAVPPRFWLYAFFALLYGICETLNGNWATVFMTTHLAASVTLSSLALTVFWVMVTGGRVLFAAIEKWCPPRLVLRALPVFLVPTFLATSFVPHSQPMAGLVAFSLAGLGCSALLPLVISFGQEELKSMSATVAGGLIGFYQMGYGLAAFGVGPLQSAVHLELPVIYRGAAALAMALSFVAFLIAGRKSSG